MIERIVNVKSGQILFIILIAYGFIINGFAATENISRVQGYEQLYMAHCGTCHGNSRLGGIGPALLPGNLKRLRQKQAKNVIANGRIATQMPGFANILTRQQIDALVNYIYSPPAQMPHWDIAEIEKSHIILNNKLPDKPVFKADLQNLFVVVESGDHHVTILNGDTFEPVHRFKSRIALHGGPKYSPDGRFVYFASRDGWITKYDIYNLKIVAEIRAGINTRNAAVSFDGRYVIVGNYLPHTIVLLNAEDLSLNRIIHTKNIVDQSSRISAVYTAPPRDSFIVALKDVPEVWEISYADNPPDRFLGWVHDFHQESGDKHGKNPGSFPVRRIKLQAYLDDFFFDQTYTYLLGASRPLDKPDTKGVTGNSGQKTADKKHPEKKSKVASGQVVHLDVGRKIADLDLPGMPHLGSGISWQYKNRWVVATPNIKTGDVSIIDMNTWQVIKQLNTLGPGFFMRSHAESPYAWVDVFFGPHKDKMHIIDKKTLEIVKTLQPAPGKTAAHVEFTKDGRYALLSIWDNDGAIVVYDSKNLKELKRIKMSKPSGKYNVYNKTHYEIGTSH